MRGAILAGGAASRFDGKPKGLQKVGGERIVDRVARCLQEALGAAPLLVANATDATEWCHGLQIVNDIMPECGSLGGIYTAVSHEDSPVLVVAWDMPFVPVDLLTALTQAANGFDVLLPESGGRRGIEPLCGVYGPACSRPIRASLDDEDYRATGFHENMNVGRFPLAEVQKYGDPARIFFNVNTPKDLAEAEELWRNQRA